MAWSRGRKLFSRSFDNKCLQIQGIQAARSWLHIKNKAISKEPWEIWPGGSACCIYSVIKCCASVPEPTVSLIYCNTRMSEFLNDKFSEYISAEKADWQITSQTTRKTWRVDWGCCTGSCPNTVSIPAVWDWVSLTTHLGASLGQHWRTSIYSEWECVSTGLRQGRRETVIYVFLP